jgi:tetratricopeptide (TPR) repeat protein
MAEDLRRWQEDRPIRARRPGLGQRLRKWGRRHRPAVAAAAACLLVAVAALAGGVGWIAGERRARRAETGRVVEAALADAGEWLRKDRPYEALSAALRAEGLLRQAGGHPGLQPRVDEMLWDVRLLLRLEQARLSHSGVETDHFDNKAPDEDYERAFAEFGLHVLAGNNAGVVERIKGRQIGVELAAFLDHWAIVRLGARGAGDPGWRQLLTVAGHADPDPGRARFREALSRQDKTGLMRLAQEGVLDGLNARSLTSLVFVNGIPTVAGTHVEALLRRAQRQSPDDFWVNHNLAFFLQHSEPPQVDEAIAFLRVAVALRPQSPGALVNLGTILAKKGRLDEAATCYRDAVRIKPDYAQAHSNLGALLEKKGRLDEAAVCLREAIRIKQGYPEAHYGLGIVLVAKGEVDQAIACYREAIRIKPDFAEAHCNLGDALQRQGRFAEALGARRRGHELGSKQRGWPYPSAEWVREAERLVDLDRKLPAVLEGKQRPADPAEAAALADLCAQYKGRPATAARLFQEAFAADPRLAKNLHSHRYNAACAAALAAAGKGQDAAGLDPNERSRLRRQAIAWLRADLKAWRQVFEKGPAKARPAVVQTMRHWLADDDFAAVRGPQALAKLPEAERSAWHNLWALVADTLARASDPMKPVGG